MGSTLWYRVPSVDGTDLTPAVTDAFAACGLELTEAAADQPLACCVVFVPQITPGIGAFIGDVVRANGPGVVAVALPGVRVSPADVWNLLACGAADVLCWDRCADAAREVAARTSRWTTVNKLLDSAVVRTHVIGRSSTWRATLRQVVEAAHFSAAPVLITGESGTGKELLARLIHTLDARPSKKELVVVDCTTIVPELSGSEFFGHERGAFTGAVGAREGAFALAHEGTLFLDEVGELPLPMQAQLLRVVQERMFKRVGGNQWQRTDFRLVCATNRDLQAEVAANRFRADLYYRIASLTCRVPPLRDRPEDVIPLFQHFLAECSNALESPVIDDAVRDCLLRREYPGNVRELKQLAVRVAARHVGPGAITAGALPRDERPTAVPDDDHWRDASFDQAITRALECRVPLQEIGRIAAETAIRIALAQEQGNVQRAARRLGVTDRALQMRRAATRQRPHTATTE